MVVHDAAYIQFDTNLYEVYPELATPREYTPNHLKLSNFDQNDQHPRSLAEP